MGPRAVDLGVYQHHTAYGTPAKVYTQELVRLSEKNGAFETRQRRQLMSQEGAPQAT